MLSRRDEFAKAAMEGWVAGLGEVLDEYIDDDKCFAEHQAKVAEAAVGYADALIANLDGNTNTISGACDLCPAWRAEIASLRAELDEQRAYAVSYGREVFELRAELAKYTGDLTQEQAWKAFNDTPLVELGDGPVAMVRAQDVAIRKARSGEGANNG